MQGENKGLRVLMFFYVIFSCQAFEIRDKYLQKWRDQVKTAENEANDALQAHEEAKKKVCGEKSPVTFTCVCIIFLYCMTAMQHEFSYRRCEFPVRLTSNARGGWLT